jgi:hypothetical protein
MKSMTPSTGRLHVLRVVVAAAVAVLLTGTLAARLIGRSAAPHPEAPYGVVPSPVSVAIDELEVPCWSCGESKEWAVRFRTDLDLLAPLGNGPANAADYFKDFTKVPEGPRYQEFVQARKAAVAGPDWLGDVLPPGHPLLSEAEPWCDQATMRFYPEIYPLDGYRTRIPNLLHMLHLAKGWVARGMATEDAESALADFRRAIRLGRLLRQEDGVIISDLVGLACIRFGAEGIYRRSVAAGDLERAVIASVVVGEVAPQRLITSERLTSADLAASARIDGDGQLDLRLKDEDLDRAIDVAVTGPDRRFRAEAIVMLHLVRHLGTASQETRVLEVLDELSVSPDPVIAEVARWSRDTPLDEEDLKEAFDLD